MDAQIKNLIEKAKAAGNVFTVQYLDPADVWQTEEITLGRYEPDSIDPFVTYQAIRVSDGRRLSETCPTKEEAVCEARIELRHLSFEG